MTKQYVMVRMPRDIYEMFYNKKIKMQKDVKIMTGKEIPITMPRVFKLVASNPVEIERKTLLKNLPKRYKEIF